MFTKRKGVISMDAPAMAPVIVIALVVSVVALVFSLMLFRLFKRERTLREKLSRRLDEVTRQPASAPEKYYRDEGDVSYSDSHGPRAGGSAPQGSLRPQVIDYHDR